MESRIVPMVGIQSRKRDGKGKVALERSIENMTYLGYPSGR